MSSGRARSGRDVDLDHVEPVETGPRGNRPSLTSFSRSLLVAVTTRTSTSKRLVPSQRARTVVPGGRGAAWPAWPARMSPISSRKIVPLVRQLEPALAPPFRRGERPPVRGRTIRFRASFSGRAAQLTATQVSPGDPRSNSAPPWRSAPCPVPVSPSISTVLLVPPMCRTSSKISCIFGFLLMMLLKLYTSFNCWRSWSTSSWSSRFLEGPRQ